MQLLARKMQSSNVYTLCTQYCSLIEVFCLLNFDEFFFWIYRFLICNLFPPIYNSVNFQSIASQYTVNFLCRHDGTFNWIWTRSWADWVNLQWINNCSLFFLKIKLAFSMYMALSDGIWNVLQKYWNSNHLTVFSVSLLSPYMLSSIAIYFLDLTSISIFMSHEWAFSNAIC
jgi:hypothetical protein